jgi:hypothetical protein
MNPDGLPVGFAKDAGDERAWLGFNCAACHTTEIHYKGVGYRIDGGPAMGDIRGLLLTLTEALKATRDDAGSSAGSPPRCSPATTAPASGRSSRRT